MALRTNFDENPLVASIIFFPSLGAVLYSVYRVMCLKILSRQLNVGAVGWLVKMVLAGFPAIYAFSVLFRTSSPHMQDACPVFIPFAYLIRLSTHSFLLCYQATVIFVARHSFVSLKKRADIPLFILLITEIPVLAFTISTWSLGLGINLGGSCTLGRSDKSDVVFWDVSAWAFTAELMELFYCICNIVAELLLRRVHLSATAKKELFALTRFSTCLICCDLFYQLKFFNKLTSFIENKQAVATAQMVYAIAFLTLYYSGFSSFCAFFISRDAFLYFDFNPFRLYFWNLLFGKARLPPEKVEAYNLKKIEESRISRMDPTELSSMERNSCLRMHGVGSSLSTPLIPSP